MPAKEVKQIIIVCGPTASGKTEFAHHLALTQNGEIINCDSRQLYRQTPILTASPPPALKNEIPYHLYNFLDLAEEFSFVKYVGLAVEKIREISERNKLPIIVGGTGLYINALISGYNQVPEVSNTTRQDVQNLRDEVGQPEFYRLLKNLDPIAAGRLNITDRQRTLRAYEVFIETGKSITLFQQEKNIIPLPDFNFQIIFLHPQRSFLHSVCNTRLEQIFRNGAIEEIKAIREKSITIKPKIIGTQEIIDLLDGNISYKEAITKAQDQTRQYAKRQITWFKNQLHSKTTLEYASREEFENSVIPAQAGIRL